MEKHLKILGILYVFSGTMFLLGALFFGVMFTGAGLMFGDLGAFALFSGLGALGGGLFVLAGLPSIVGGIGLLRRRPWARMLVMVVAVLQILSVAGVLVGGYALWVLTQPESVRLLGGGTVAAS